jgi:hypothetical protein
MIDVYATAGTFTDKHRLAADLAATLMAIEGVPDIPMFRQNTAGFVHELPAGDLSNVDGASGYVRVQVLTNAGALDRDKQLAVVSQFTSMVADAAGDPALAGRTWVLLTEAVPGGWGLWGHANTNDELVARPASRSPSCRQTPGSPPPNRRNRRMPTAASPSPVIPVSGRQRYAAGPPPSRPGTATSSSCPCCSSSCPSYPSWPCPSPRFPTYQVNEMLTRRVNVSLTGGDCRLR